MRSMITVVPRRRIRSLPRLGLQAASAVLLNLRWVGVTALSCPAPVMNCHSCPAASFACPVGVVVNFSATRLVPFFTVGMLGVTGVTLGRLTCGWVCPFGMVQDLVARLRPAARSTRIPERLGVARYAIFVCLVVLLPLLTGASDEQGAANFCSVCPVGGIEATLPTLAGVNSLSTSASAVASASATALAAAAATGGSRAPFGVGVVVKLLVVAAALGASLVVYRPFCRVVCPVGLVLGQLADHAAVKLRVDAEQCRSCGVCARACRMDLDPVRVASGDARAGCIMCLDCAARCPRGAISLGIGPK